MSGSIIPILGTQLRRRVRSAEKRLVVIYKEETVETIAVRRAVPMQYTITGILDWDPCILRPASTPGGVEYTSTPVENTAMDKEIFSGLMTIVGRFRRIYLHFRCRK